MQKLTNKVMAIILFLIPVFQLNAEWGNWRDYETIVMQGSQLQGFLAAPLDELFFFRFDSASETWQQITHQIDERDGSWDYFITANGILDANDEIAFLARDAGDKAREFQWINDENSRSFPRVELKIADPLNPENERYVYVYRSQTQTPDPDLPVYLQYIPGNDGYSDSLSASGYYIGHSKYGIIDRWRILQENGGQNIDILDRMKARVKGKVAGISLNKTEQDLKVDTYKKKIGPIRMIREIKYKISTFGLTFTVGTFRFMYYPFHIVGLGSNKTLTTDFNISLIRQSFDLNLYGIGMTFNNPLNVDIPVDGTPDAVDKTVYPLPETNWYMCSGNPGTFVMINEFTALENASYRLYYHDSSAGGTDDGTSDTGVDDKSYADTGILFTGSKIVGQFSLPFQTYFLPANQSREVGLQIVENYKNPLTVQPLSQNFTLPVIASVSIPDTNAQWQMPISLPVRIAELGSEEVTRLQMIILFDTVNLRLDSVSVLNSLTDLWDSTLVKNSADSIFIDFSNFSPLDTTGGNLCWINFTPIGPVGSVAEVAIDTVILNDGYPFVTFRSGAISILEPPEVTISLPDTSVFAGASVSIPIFVSDLSSLLVQDVHLAIQFSKFVLQGTSVSLENTLAQGHDFSFSSSGGTAIIDITASEPLQGSGVLAWLNFDVVGDNGSATDISFSEAQFNAGAPVAIPQNGHVSVVAPPPVEVAFSLPDTIVSPQTSLKIPIKVSDLTPVNVTSFRINLSFDEAVIDYISLTKDSTMTKNWNPSVYDLGNSLVIVGGGSPALQGKGVLLFLNFEIVGGNGSQSAIVFDAVQLGGGSSTIFTNDGSVSVQGVIPVELAHFSARVINGQVHLNWLTLSESDNYGFYLQRKTETVPWQEIGFVPAAENPSVTNHYTYIDAHLLSGNIFYRLKQQDLDGSVNFSHEIKVSITIPQAISLKQNYPNPFNSSTMIKYEIDGEFEGDLSLTIYNTLGQPIRNLIDQQRASAGGYQIIWDGKNDSGLPVSSGVYYLRLVAGKTTLYRKLLFLR